MSDLFPLPATQVAATPTDTFVRTNADDQLSQLAKGLSTFHRGVANLAGTLIDQGNQEDTQAGLEAARAAQSRNIKSYSDAIKAGVIDPSKSPYYQAAAQEQFGRVAAGQMEADAFVAATQDPVLQSSTDPQDYSKWRNKFQADWLEKNVGPDSAGGNFQTGFGHANDVYTQDSLNKFSEIAAQRLQQNVADMGFQETKVALGRQLDLTPPPGETWTLDQRQQMAGEQITKMGQIARAANPKGARVFFENAAKAIAAEAIERNDLSVLETMKQVQMGSGTLDSTSYGTATYIAAKRQILSDKAEAYRLDKDQRDADLTQKTDRLVGGAAAGFIKDPNYNPRKDIEAAQAAGDWEAIGKIQAMSDSFRKHDYLDDTNKYASLSRRIYDVNDGETATSMKELGEAVANKQLTPQSFLELSAKLQEEEDKGGAGKKFSKDPDLNEGKAALRRLFTNDFGAVFSSEVANRADKAQDDFTNAYITWKLSPEGQKASQAQVQKFLQDQKDKSYEKYSGISDSKQRATLATPVVAGSSNVPDWNKTLVTDRENIGNLSQNWTELKLGKTSTLSKTSIATLQHAGIDPSSKTFVADVEAFIKAQSAFAAQQ